MTTTCATLSLLCILGSAGAAPPAAAPPRPQLETADPWEPAVYEPAPELPSTPVATWDPLRFGLALEGKTTFPQDDAAKRLAGKRAPAGGGLSLRAEVLRPTSRITLELDLSWLITQTTQRREDDGLSQRLTSNAFSLGASLRYQILPWLSPYVRLAGGLAWDALKLSDDAVDLHDRQIYGHGSLGGGLYFRSPSLRLFSATSTRRLGFLGRVEGGYLLAQGGEYSLHASLPAGDASPIPSSTVPIGKAERHAPYLRVSLGIAF